MGTPNEVYNLRWNNYQATLSTSVGTLLDDSDFIDVTIACEGQSFNAHKVVLSACSGYLKKLLKRNPCQHPIVILKDVRASVLNFLVQFMYHGAVDVPEDQLSDFLNAGQALEVKGLAEEDAPVRPKNMSQPESPVPAKKPRLSSPSSTSRTIVTSTSQSKSASVISARQARSLVESGAYTDGSQRNSNKDSELIEKLQSSRVSVTPASVPVQQPQQTLERRDIREAIVKEEQDEEDDLEIMEPEQETQMKLETGDGMVEVYPEDDSNQMITGLEDGSTQDYSYDESQASLLEYEDGQSSMAGPSSGLEGTPQGWTSRGRHTCPHCSESFTRRHSVQVHILRKHKTVPLEDQNPCPVCSKMFKLRNDMKNHMRRVHGVISLG